MLKKIVYKSMKKVFIIRVPFLLILGRPHPTYNFSMQRMLYKFDIKFPQKKYVHSCKVFIHQEHSLLKWQKNISISSSICIFIKKKHLQN